MSSNDTRRSKKNAAKGKPCGLLRRLAIMLYDSVIMLALLMLATLLPVLAGFERLTALRDPGYTAYLLFVCFMYLAWFWRSGGATVGMKAWRVRIEDTQGNRPGWKQVSIRFFAALLSAAALGLGYLWSLFDDRKRTWHDRLSGTRLVRT